MGAAVEILVECETATDVWTDLTPDVMASDGLNISYGIAGDKPMDTVAGTGQCSFTLLGLKYSFHHADALAGFVFGAGIRVVMYRTTDTAQSVSSLARSGGTATATTAASHGYSVDDWITIAGATGDPDWNGTFQITAVPSVTTFEYDLGIHRPGGDTGTLTARIGYIRHRGKLRSADPNPGAYRTHRVAVTSYDGMRDLAETKVRTIDVAINKTETELLTLMLDSLPAVAQPLRRDFDTGVDSFPYAFNELGTGTVALTVAKHIAVSAFATIFMRGDGTLVLQSRDTRSSGASKFHFDETMSGLTTAANVDELVNNVRCTISPRTIDALATTVIASTTGTPISVDVGETLTVYLDYRDPTETQTLIGGTAIVDPLVSGTDYRGYSTVTGTGGSDLSSSLSIAMTPYASTAKLIITNNHVSSTIYLVDADGNAFLQLRGKGIYEKSSQSFSAVSDRPYGDKMLTIDLKYQASPTLAQSYALVVEENFNDQASAALESITFNANDSDDLLLQSLARNPGEIISITESTVGASQIDMVIQSVALDITKGPWVTCTYGVAPATAFAMWLLGETGRSELDQTTILGF